MISAIHTLQIKSVTASSEDDYGRPIEGTTTWTTVCKCRCDDISAEKRVSVNGSLYDFKYKVVFDKQYSVKEGSEVRCLRADGSVRGQGVAKSPMETNFLRYKTIWLE